MMVAWCLFVPVGGVGDGMGEEGCNTVAVVFVKEMSSALVEARGGSSGYSRPIISDTVADPVADAMHCGGYAV
jgi:hypothetical protein